MHDNMALKLSEVSDDIEKAGIPLWEDLPALDLYMDQVITLLERNQFI